MNKKILSIGIFFVGISIVFAFGSFFLSRKPSAESVLAPAKPTEIVDLKDGDTYNLTAEIIRKKIGNEEIRMFGYNGSIPGPMIRVPKGAEITINFTNQTDIPTTIHSHGVRLNNAFDGVPDVTQKAIQPGESFSYTINFPDQGMYWYHPHIREDYAQELGLYGNYLVSDASTPWSPVNNEWALFLDDILVQDGRVQLNKEKVDHTLMGRFGNVMLVNGEVHPTFSARKGDVVRLFLTNAANTRTFQLRLPGAKMKLVGGDAGAYERETWAETILLGPSERGIVEVFFEKSGEYTLEHITPTKTYALAGITVGSEIPTISYQKQFETLHVHPETISSIDPFRPYFTKKADKSITLSLAMKQMMGAGQGMHAMHGGGAMPDTMMRMGDVKKIEWEDDMGMMNANATVDTIEWRIIDNETKRVNMDIDWRFQVGDKIKVKIFNDPDSMHPMQHPIHFHGQRFLILSTNGVSNTNLVWKDTTLIQTGDTVEILVDMSNPGTWMAHCHIAEHLEAGMMFGFTIQ